MSKYNSLKKLYSEIELLESAGLIKAANVLHKKFVKEAQAKPANDLMKEIFLLAQNPGPDFDNLILYVKRMLDSSPPYNEDEIEAIKRSIEKAQKQRQNIGAFSTTVAPPNQTLAPAQTAAPSTPSTPSTPSVQDPTAPIGDLSDQVKAEQFDIAFRGLGNSLNQAAQEKKERRLYMNALNDIILAFKEPNKEAGEAIFQKTVTQFQNPIRKQLFINQIDRQRRKYFAQGPSLPEMSDAEGQQLTSLVNQNVARNSPSAPTQTTQTNTNKPNVGTNSDVNNLLYQIVSNFYRQKDMTVTSPEQMYADLKADPARKNVVRNHIRASGNPSTNQLVALFDSKTK